MKRIRISGWCVVLVVVFLLITSGICSASTIALWDYNDGDKIVDTGAGTQGFAVAEGTVNLTEQFVTASGQSAYRVNYTEISNASSGVTWSLSTTNFTDIGMSVQLIRNSSSIPRYLHLYYNDGTWNPIGAQIDLGSSTSSSNTWQTLNFNLSSIWGPGAENNPNFIVGLFEDGQPTSSFTTAYHIMDNVEFTGNQVPVPAAVWLLGTGLVGLVGLRRRCRFSK